MALKNGTYLWRKVAAMIVLVLGMHAAVGFAETASSGENGIQSVFYGIRG